MSNFKVPYTTILDIKPHNNADKLEVATVYGFQVIIKKDQYKVGDRVVYVPIDSILPQKLEDAIFPPESKIKLNKHRVRQIRIRQLASQGMLIDHHTIQQVYGLVSFIEEGDMAVDLGITKYEPPERNIGPAGKVGGRKKVGENPNFHKYNGLENVKWYPEKFKQDEMIVLQEKIHGMNARAGLVPFVPTTLWHKLKGFFGLNPKHQFCYGSNNVQIQDKVSYTGYYGTDIHGKVFKEMQISTKLKENEVVYGEIYGEGIQKNYSYGLSGVQKFILFDVKVVNSDGSQKWLSPNEVEAFAKERGFDLVPELYRGPYKELAFVETYAEGASVLCPNQKVREGVVVKSLDNYDECGNKRALKIISKAYLDDKSNTDFH